ncbi:uncharacterized protein IL334_003825 [Kwoniella shivajii]|uniref:Uncharacterized protein n=1 Tax=Kwoniella shivajii TaxID=564305 RepID=A0ABZ1CYN8_9TREE|nr:hypothetical protein IL334_003825 [Kwoniella shivajii]
MEDTNAFTTTTTTGDAESIPCYIESIDPSSDAVDDPVNEWKRPEKKNPNTPEYVYSEGHTSHCTHANIELGIKELIKDKKDSDREKVLSDQGLALGYLIKAFSSLSRNIEADSRVKAKIETDIVDEYENEKDDINVNGNKNGSIISGVSRDVNSLHHTRILIWDPETSERLHKFRTSSGTVDNSDNNDPNTNNFKCAGYHCMGYDLKSQYDSNKGILTVCDEYMEEGSEENLICNDHDLDDFLLMDKTQINDFMTNESHLFPTDELTTITAENWGYKPKMSENYKSQVESSTECITEHVVKDIKRSDDFLDYLEQQMAASNLRPWSEKKTTSTGLVYVTRFASLREKDHWDLFDGIKRLIPLGKDIVESPTDHIPGYNFQFLAVKGMTIQSSKPKPEPKPKGSDIFEFLNLSESDNDSEQEVEQQEECILKILSWDKKTGLTKHTTKPDCEHLECVGWHELTPELIGAIRSNRGNSSETKYDEGDEYRCERITNAADLQMSAKDLSEILRSENLSHLKKSDTVSSAVALYRHHPNDKDRLWLDYNLPTESRPPLQSAVAHNTDVLWSEVPHHPYIPLRDRKVSDWVERIREEFEPEGKERSSHLQDRVK